MNPTFFHHDILPRNEYTFFHCDVYSQGHKQVVPSLYLTNKTAIITWTLWGQLEKRCYYNTPMTPATAKLCQSVCNCKIGEVC